MLCDLPGAVLSELYLDVYDENGLPIHREALADDALTDEYARARLEREAIHPRAFRYAVASSARSVHGLYLAPDLVPASSVQYAGPARSPGRWLLWRAHTGGLGGGVVFVGPDLVLRRVDLAPAEAWLAPMLALLAPTIPTRRVALPDAEVHAWHDARGRWYSVEQRARFSVWGSGPVADGALAGLVADDAVSWLIAAGAVPVSARRVLPDPRGLDYLRAPPD